MSEMSSLSRRERQVMEVIYAKGEATATDVLQSLPDSPTRAAVRTFLRILEAKGHVKHIKRGREFVYHRRFLPSFSLFASVGFNLRPSVLVASKSDVGAPSCGFAYTTAEFRIRVNSCSCSGHRRFVVNSPFSG